MFDIIDSETCFSKDIGPYHMIKGEFDVCERYFHAKAEITESSSEAQPPNKKRKKKNTKAPSVAEIETQKRHEELRPQLVSCLESIQEVWPNKWKENKVPSAATTKETVEKDTIDFPSIQTMVETAHGKFSNKFQADNEDEQKDAPAEFILSDYITKGLDLFSIFNLVCINAEKKRLKLLQITPSCQYLIPPKSTFLMGSIANSAKQLGSYVNKIGGADLIVMDPPWPNKSVSRSSHYETQDIYDLYSVPILEMISTKNCLVAIWVTNKPKFRKFIIKKLFPSWKLECAGEWTWLKVTTQAECIFPMDSMHKKPYEQLIIGRPIINSRSDKENDILVVPKTHTIVSIPSVRHSRKPPLEDVLKPYMSNKVDPICVELFARCLTPGWISWGNECLKFQHLNYFDKQQDDLP